MKKSTLIIVVTLIALLAVAVPVAAQSNGWFLSDPRVKLDVVACEQFTGNILTSASADYNVPNGHSSPTMIVSINGEFVKEEALDGSGTFMTGIGGTARYITVSFTLSSRGFSRTTETTFENPCFTGGIK